MKYPLLIILPDLRSAQNVGSIFRTADAVGADAVWTCGLTPYPSVVNDQRPPHVADRAAHLLSKTALGAEITLPHRHFSSLYEAIEAAHMHNYNVVALEQAEGSTDIYSYTPPQAVALVLGPEVMGLNTSDLSLCDEIIEIPMYGDKESLNVAVAAGIALYQLRHASS